MAKPREFSRSKDIEFYRQPGGCIEIWQTEPGADRNMNDVIHVCGDRDLNHFIAELQAYAADTAQP